MEPSRAVAELQTLIALAKKRVRGCGDVDNWQICLHIMNADGGGRGRLQRGPAPSPPACTVVDVSAAVLRTPACTALADVISSGDAIGIFV